MNLYGGLLDISRFLPMLTHSENIFFIMPLTLSWISSLVSTTAVQIVSKWIFNHFDVDVACSQSKIHFVMIWTTVSSTDDPTRASEDFFHLCSHLNSQNLKGPGTSWRVLFRTIATLSWFRFRTLKL